LNKVLILKERNRSDFQRMMGRAWQEVKDAVLPKKEVQSITRVRTDVTPVNKAKYDGPTQIVRTKPRESLFSRMAKMLHKQVAKLGPTHFQRQISARQQSSLYPAARY